MSNRVTEFPRPDHMLVQISDSHLLPSGRGPLNGDVDEGALLEAALRRVVEFGIAPEALIFTGDQADQGEEGSYQRLRALVDPVAEELGAKVIWTMGNHDDRRAFRHGLLGLEPTLEPWNDVVMLGGLRVIVIDSTVPGRGWGQVTPTTLEWLQAILAIPAREGSILAIHHPPMPTVQDMAATVELRDTESLAAVLRGSDVRSIIAGHVHYTTFATFAGIPVIAIASSAYTQDVFTPGRGTRGRDACQGLSYIHVFRDTIMHTAYPIVAGSTVGRFIDAAETARILADEGYLIADPPPMGD